MTDYIYLYMDKDKGDHSYVLEYALLNFPFQCEICKKQFREKSNYNYHLKKHDNLSAIKNKEKNKNDFCKYKFKRIHKSSDNFNTTKSNSNNLLVFYIELFLNIKMI